MTIEASVVDDLMSHAREAAPFECCGLLAGRRGFVARSIRTRNIEESATRFRIDPADHFAAIHAVRQEGLRVIGAYHSHTRSAAVPSESDIVEAAGDADFLYVIVSIAEDVKDVERVAAYRLHRGQVIPVPLSVGSS